MEIVLTTSSQEQAIELKKKIIHTVNLSNPDIQWVYNRYSEHEEAIYHRPMDPEAPVMFLVEQEDDRVVFFPVHSRNTPKASFVICCTHFGHLTEMLLTNFYDDFIRLEINK